MTNRGRISVWLFRVLYVVLFYSVIMRRQNYSGEIVSEFRDGIEIILVW